MSNPAVRLINLLELLQTRPNQKVAHLAKALDVSPRTLHRYLAMLEDWGIPIYTERGPEGGISLVRGFRLPPLIFSPQEAGAVILGLHMMIEMWGRMYQHPAQSALTKLENVLPATQQQEVLWARRTFIATGMHVIDGEELSPIMEGLQTAIRQEQCVRFVYHAYDATSERKVAPYALIHRWGYWYFLGFCFLREAIRTFRIDRIEDLTLLEERRPIPQDFDIFQYLEEEFKNHPLQRIRLQFLPEAKNQASSYASYWDDLQEQADGTVITTLDTPDLEWTTSFILGLGGGVRVLEPESLRRHVVTQAEAMLKANR